MLPARLRVLIVLVVAAGLPVAAQEPSRDPGAIVLLVETEGHTTDAESQRASVDSDPRTRAPTAQPTLADAQRLFFNAHYQQAADLALKLRETGPHDLANDEVRTTALLFVLRGLLKGQDAHNGDDKAAALKACTKCPEVLATFAADLKHGQELARGLLKTNPRDENTLFYLGKLDLNFVWLHLGLLGKKTGWDEYWEARKSLDALLKVNPAHVRGRVARGWIDYIVNTRMPWGTRWVLGGGNKKKGLAAVREAAAVPADEFSHAEAEFALWDMLLRDKNVPAAIEVARRIAKAYPENGEVAAFLAAHASR
jgi:tetratricopeptide (TPR) repeat protein